MNNCRIFNLKCFNPLAGLETVRFNIKMIFLGIDPGIATTGYGLVEKNGNKLRLVEYGAILTPSSDSISKRLLSLADQLDAIVARYQPESVAVEELFFNTNVKTAMVVSQARGVILLSIERAGLPVTSYTPVQVKIGVSGYGRADKNQVQQMVKQLLALSQIPKPDDAADALAIAICHAHSVRIKSLK